MNLRRNEQDYQNKGWGVTRQEKESAAAQGDSPSFPPFQNHSLVPQTTPPVGCFPAAQPQARQRWVKRGEKQGGGLGGGWECRGLHAKATTRRERKGEGLSRHP